MSLGVLALSIALWLCQVVCDCCNSVCICLTDLDAAVCVYITFVLAAVSYSGSRGVPAVLV